MTLLDVSSLPKFGNLLQGGGVAAVFDGQNSTAWAEGSVGWVGVDMSNQPKRINYVEIVSAVNGFDASGSNTPIELELRAKNGASPSDFSDGVLLASHSFMDVNVQRSMTLYASDKHTKWDFVWVVIKSEIWAVAAELRIFETAAIRVETPQAHIFRRSCGEKINLNFSAVEFAPIRISFELSETRVVSHDFHGDFIHTGYAYNGSQSFQGVVGVGVFVVRRCSPTLDGLASAPWISDDNEVGGGNILSISQHYLNKSISGAVELGVGFHEFSVWASCHTALLPLNNDAQKGIVQVLAEGESPPYKGRNLLRVEVKPVGSIMSKL